MTREEARSYIIRHCNPDYPNGKTEWETAINMAIKALSREPSEDCISRKALLAHFYPWLKVEDYSIGERNMLKALLYEVKVFPPAKPEQRSSSCGQENDLISRQAAIDALMEILDRPNHAEFLYTDEICEALQNLPSAQPERKTGRWIDNETSYVDDARQTCTCSVCGRRSHRPLGCFCRWCGARMEADT